MENWQIKIKDVGYKVTREVYIFRRWNGGTDVLQPDGSIKSYKQGELMDVKPIIELEPEMLQELSNELSQLGYKPDKGHTLGKLEATEKHLEDMRKLVFKD